MHARAMLGLDPYNSSRQDDSRALDVAARAVAMARRLNWSDAGAPKGTRGLSASGERLGPPSILSASPRISPPSSSSSDSSEEEHRIDRQSSGGSLGRGRMSSFLNMSRAGRRHRQQQQMQQQMQYQMQQQQQQEQMLSQHRQQGGVVGGATASAHRPVSSTGLVGGADGWDSFVPVRTWHPSGHQGAIGGYHDKQPRRYGEGGVGRRYLETGRGVVVGDAVGDAAATTADSGAVGATPTLPAAAAAEIGGESDGVGGSALGDRAVEMTWWHRDRDDGIGRRMLPRGGPASDGVASGHPTASAKLSSSSHRRKGRGRHDSRRRATSGAGSAGGGEVMPAAVEDMERPVLPSFASSGGSQHSLARLRSAEDWPPPMHQDGPPRRPLSGGVHSNSDHQAKQNGPFPLRGDSPGRQGGAGVRVPTHSVHSARGAPQRGTPAQGLGRPLASRGDVAAGGSVHAALVPTAHVGVHVSDIRDGAGATLNLGGGGEGEDTARPSSATLSGSGPAAAEGAVSPGYVRGVGSFRGGVDNKAE